MTDLRQALATPEQKPVGYVTDSGKSAYILLGVDLEDDTPVYATPPHYWGNVTNAELVEELRRRGMMESLYPEQEPVAWQDPQYKTLIEPHKAHPDWIPLYTAPPKREWVGLTRRELDIATLGLEDLSDCYKAIEAKLKEKNT